MYACMHAFKSVLIPGLIPPVFWQVFKVASTFLELGKRLAKVHPSAFVSNLSLCLCVGLDLTASQFKLDTLTLHQTLSKCSNKAISYTKGVWHLRL